MCQMSTKLPAMFDQDTDYNKKRSHCLTLSLNVKVTAEINRQGPGKQKSCHPKKFEQRIPY